jgi:hypothetical protein
MRAGDTTIVTAGTYNEKVSTARSGTASARITFRASGKAITKTFNVGHDYITIDGFEMTGANEGYMLPITGSYCEILNNTIHDTGSSWGIVRIASDSSKNCVIKNNRFYSSQSASDDLPVIILTGSGHLAEGNEIGPMKDIDAFRVWGSNETIRNNYVHDVTLTPGSAAHMDVIQNFQCCTDNVVFEKNRIVNFDGQICMTENNGQYPTGNWYIRNNVYVNVALQANIGIPNVRFYNNTFYNVGSTNKLVMYLYDAPGKSDFSGAQIKNNIFITASNITSYGQVMSVGNTGSGVQISNNYIAKIGSYGTVSGFSDSNGVNGGDPRFVNAGTNDFHLLAQSPAIGKGVTLSGFSDDFAGSARTVPWDIGAFEFSGATLTPPSGLTATVK